MVQSRLHPTSYQPINDRYPSHAPQSHVVASGETLRSLALSLWGDSSLWYILAEENGLNGDETLVAGTRLNVPNVVTNFHNNASTFRPFDPFMVMGDTSPSLPTGMRLYSEEELSQMEQMALGYSAMASAALMAQAAGITSGGILDSHRFDGIPTYGVTGRIDSAQLAGQLWQQEHQQQMQQQQAAYNAFIAGINALPGQGSTIVPYDPIKSPVGNLNIGSSYSNVMGGLNTGSFLPVLQDSFGWDAGSVGLNLDLDTDFSSDFGLVRIPAKVDTESGHGGQ